MNALLEQANKLLATVQLNREAHQVSFENHYMKDQWIGNASKIVSAVVGAGVFTVLVSKLGLSGNSGSITVPPGARWLYWIVLLLSLAAPALTAVSLFKDHRKDAEEHRRCKSNYNELEGDLERFLRRYQESDMSSSRDTPPTSQAEKDFEQIRQKFNAALTETEKIGLFRKALDEARRRLNRAT